MVLKDHEADSGAHDGIDLRQLCQLYHILIYLKPL